MTRFRNLTLFAAAAALSIGLIACGGSGGGDESPQQVLKGATLKGIESGNVDLTMKIKAQGDQGGDLNVSLSGPFQGRGTEQLPLFDVSATVKGSMGGRDVDFDGGLILTRDGAFVSYAGSAYQVDESIFDGLEQRFSQAAGQTSDGNGGQNVNKACRNKIDQLNLGDFFTDLSNEGTEEIGGVETTHVSGDLDIEQGVATLVNLAADPACQGQIGSLPVPPVSAIGQFRDSVKSASVDLYVGDDGIVRRAAGTVSVDPPDSGDGVDSADLSFDLTLTEVNRAQVIRAPQGAQPLEKLLRQLGVDTSVLNALGGLNGLNGLGGLSGALPGLGGGSSSGGGTPGATDVPGIDTESQQAYLECLQGATTPADLQRCAQQAGN